MGTRINERVGKAFEDLYYQCDDIKERLVFEYRAGKRLTWPVAGRQLLHRVWLGFSETGRVQDERALDNILASMRESLAHLTIATIVAEHSELDRADFLSGLIDDEDEMEAFCDWLIEDGSGYWRISDYGIKPLTEALAAAIAELRPEKRLKHLDRALNIVHARGDLSRLFVEGGRESVLEVTLGID